MNRSEWNEDRLGRLIVIAGLFVGSFLLIFAFLQQTVLPIWHSHVSREWTPVPCRIEASSLKRSVRRNGEQAFSIEVTYQYQVNGMELTGTRFDFSDTSTADEQWAFKAINRLSRGTKTICYVNPKNPSNAVLEQQLPPDFIFWNGVVLFFIAAFFTALMGLFLIAMIIGRRRKPLFLKTAPPSL